jgi:hypothetical protein
MIEMLQAEKYIAVFNFLDNCLSRRITRLVLYQHSDNHMHIYHVQHNNVSECIAFVEQPTFYAGIDTETQ